LNADILSADSRQVYRGLDLGTGKDLVEFQKYQPPIRYHGIDIVAPDEVYSLYQFQQDTYEHLSEISEHGPGNREIAILVGGTGLYMESVLRRYRIANVPENPAFRASLADRTREDLEMELRIQDPALAFQTDLSSRKRIIRALEIRASGLPDSIAYSPLPKVDFKFTVFCIAAERQALRERINRRLEARLQAGMVEEVSGLIRAGITPERLRLLGMEYREIADFILGVKDHSQMVKDLQHEIHLLAKRQETYFRGMEKRGVPVNWLSMSDGIEKLKSLIIHQSKIASNGV
jgi:tRNA dimethylallyltransferase